MVCPQNLNPSELLSTKMLTLHKSGLPGQPDKKQSSRCRIAEHRELGSFATRQLTGLKFEIFLVLRRAFCGVMAAEQILLNCMEGRVEEESS